MRTVAFTTLVIAIFVALLAVELVLARGYAGMTVAPAESTAPGVAMLVPPKPLGQPVVSATGDGEGERRLTFEGCAAMSTAVQDVCWQALSRQQAQVDTDGALDVCTHVVDPELRLECVDDVAEAITLRDRARAEQICVGVQDRKWRGQCWFGIGLAWAPTDSDYALGRCQYSEAFERFCRHDVVGEVSLVNLDAAVAFCTRGETEHADDDLTRKTCWHGIAKYLARRDIHESAAACGRATDQWRGTCFHGLGWGASERDPEGTLATCPEFGAYADYCTQGVAWQLKRADPTRSLALCEAIPTAEIRDRCVAFAQAP